MTDGAEGGLLGLHAGSRMPRDGVEVDELLRHVPEVAFAAELEGCVFPPTALAAVTAFISPAQITQLANATYVAKLRAALEALRARAHDERNGGLEFLATTLGHFLDKMAVDRHPLVVALWCRSWTRRNGRDDVPAVIAIALDEYESSRGA